MKSTKAEVAKRVSEVLKLRLGGAEFLDIREYANAPEQGWNVSDSQLRRYIQQADALCKEYFDAKAEHLLARHLLQRRQLYTHALGAGDFRTALAVLKDEAELEGLYSADQGAPPDPGGTREGTGEPKTVQEVATLLGQTIKDVRQGQMDPKLASCLASLSATLQRAIEGGEWEQRLRALEERQGAQERASRNGRGH
jgi:hypothetical protein